jgi:hypothetical protein
MTSFAFYRLQPATFGDHDMYRALVSVVSTITYSASQGAELICSVKVVLSSDFRESILEGVGLISNRISVLEAGKQVSIPPSHEEDTGVISMASRNQQTVSFSDYEE